MELENSFVVPAGLDAAWAKLLDVESVAPCMPGATLTSHEGDEFGGGAVLVVHEGHAARRSISHRNASSTADTSSP